MSKRWTVWLTLGALVGCTEGEEPLPPEEWAWTEVARGLGGALLSITGGSANDVWTVGAEDASGASGQVGPLFLHWDGAAWETIDTSAHPGDLWWVWRASADDIWLSGAGGRILRYQPSGASFVSDMEVAGDFTLFGVWGTGASDVWTVGSNLEAGAAGIWHWDGVAWSAVPLPAEAEGTRAIFKVSGTASDDVWFCGSHGVTLHWDGAALANVPTPATADLLTISALSANEVYAAGGAGNAVLLRWDGAAWSDESPQFQPTVPGVFAGGETPIAAGYQGFIYERSGDTWEAASTGSTFDFHAGWQDPEGGIWAVGGVIASIPVRAGTIVYGGTDAPAAYP